MKTEHLAIDGSTVTIEGELDLGAPVTTTGRIVIGWVIHELTVGPVADVDALLATRSGGTTEIFSYRGGTLRVASVDEVDPATRATARQVVAVWSVGPRAISGSFPSLTPEAVIAVLDTVEVRDEGEDLWVAPRQSRWHDDPQLVKEVPGLGLLDVGPLTRERSASLPGWRGARVQGGELYKVDTRPDVPALLLVSRTAVAQVLPDDPATADAAATAAAMLTVDWARR